MALGLKNISYTVFEDGKIKDVKYDKDGNKTEVEITEEEHRKRNPEHRNSGCKQCIFTPSLKDLLLYTISLEQRQDATTKPHYIGRFHMPGWTGHSGFYLFKCKNCNAVGVDYPHGYTDGGKLYLRCSECRYKLVVHPKKDSSVYEREGMATDEYIEMENRKESLSNSQLILALIFFVFLGAYIFLRY